MSRKPNCKCDYCQEPLYRRNREGSKSCSKCRSLQAADLVTRKNDKEYNSYIESWLDNKTTGMRGKTSISRYIRKWLFEQKAECWKCSWKEKNTITNCIPLEINHIDGNFENNRPENLELICPNCHSLTSTYRSLNNGHGRPRK